MNRDEEYKYVTLQHCLFRMQEIILFVFDVSLRRTHLKNCLKNISLLPNHSWLLALKTVKRIWGVTDKVVIGDALQLFIPIRTVSFSKMRNNFSV